MVLGERRIEGQIKRRAEARQIYQQALAQGQMERCSIGESVVGQV